MNELTIKETKMINGGQYRHEPSGPTRYNGRTRSQKASDGKHIRSTLKEYAKVALVAATPGGKQAKIFAAATYLVSEL